MLKYKYLFSVFITLTFFGGLVSAQSISRTVIGASGKSVTNLSGGLFYNVGEIAVNTFSSASNLITQGFVQPADVNGSSISTNILSNSSVLIFPNPSSQTIFITSDIELNLAIIELYDIQGRKISDFNHVLKLSLTKSSIDISSLSQGAYFLMIKDKEQTPISFSRLIKM